MSAPSFSVLSFMTTLNTSSSTWAALAGLRFVLALIIVNTHLGLTYSSALSFFDLPDFYRLGRRLGPLAAIGFLVISGFSIAHSFSVAPHGFYRRRALRVYPTLAFAIAIYLAGLQVWGPIRTASGVLVGMPPLAEAVAPFLALNGITHGSFLGPTWSLSVELLFYAFTPLIAWMPRWALLAAIAMSAVLHAFNEALGIGTYPGAFHGLAAASLFWAWGAGFYFYRYPGWAAAAGIALLGGILLTRFNYEGGVWARQTFVGAIGVIAVASLARLRLSLPERTLNYLGDLSFPLFLLHMPVIVFGNGVFGIQSAPVLVAAALALSVFCLHCVERPIALSFKRPSIGSVRMAGQGAP